MTRSAWDRPSVGLASLIAIIATGAAVSYTTESLLLGSLSIVLLVASLRHYFFPTRYVVDECGIAVHCLGLTARRPWTRLRRFRYDDAGGFLSTRSRPSFLDSWTGLHLTWAGNRDAAVPLIEGYLAEFGRGEGTRRDAGLRAPLTPVPSPQGEGTQSAPGVGGSVRCSNG